jgi:hypothetical protein
MMPVVLRSAVIGSARLSGFAALLLVACDGQSPRPSQLVINELMSNNEGAAIDEQGELEDWLELSNHGDQPVQLAEYSLVDSGGQPTPLPPRLVAPGERIVFWADDSTEQGELHLPFKLSSGGDSLALQHVEQGQVDLVEFPELAENESFARFIDSTGSFSTCRYATPGRSNGLACEPPSRPAPTDAVSYADYQWPAYWPSPQGPVTFSELALNPADFIEVLNISDRAVPLHEYAVRLSAHAPGLPWPNAQAGIALDWGEPDLLPPGERRVLSVPASAVSAIAEDEHFSGVASLFEVITGNAIERVELEDFPENSALAREGDRGLLRFCEGSSKGAANSNCDPLTSREVGGRLGNLRSAADFRALAEGGTSVGIESVKFIVDLAAGNVVHFLSSRDYALHYTFVREEINHEEHLDRCDPVQAAEFYQGWVEFSQEEYFRTQGRRYLLGTLNHHVGQDLHTVDFTEGDAISAEQMLHAFFTVTAQVYNPKSWVLHPTNDEQVARLLTVNGRAPIVGQNAPYRDITLQPLATGVGYGQLRFIPAEELRRTALGQDVIVITDDVPNDIPFVGGLITEAFQTPLAHVNVLSRSRNTPNLALQDAHRDPQVAPYLNELVRFEVTAGGFTIEPADLADARAFWESRRPEGPRLAPRLDLSSRELQSLSDHGFASIPLIGAKAAQFAELQRLFRARQPAGTALPMPEKAFAIPVVHYLEHFDDSGAKALYEASATQLSNPSLRPDALAAIRNTIQQYPIDSGLVRELEQRLRRDFGNERVRFRSSSNTEDLADFNGAGLYTSTSAELDDPDRSIVSALHTVWASLWNNRAYDEREYANIDHSQAAMGVLIHHAHLSEKANGVAISRNIFDPIRADQYYVNAQIGEAAVTNPAPGVTSEEFVVRWTWPGHPITYSSASSLTPNRVLSQAEVDQLIVYLRDIHDHFQPLVDPEMSNRWFAVDIEFKLIDADRRLIVKQARPYSFGQTTFPDDCREF